MNAFTANMVSRLLSGYVEGITKEMLDVNIFSGDLVLTNAKIKKAALESFDLPFDVERGVVKKLTLKVPWAHIKTRHAQLLVDGISLLAKPRDPCSRTWSAEEENKRLQDVKSQRLAAFEDMRASKEGRSGGAGWSAKLVELVVSNLKVEIKNVHMCFEDNSPQTSPYLIGVKWDKLNLEPTNGEWIPMLLTELMSTINKLAVLTNLSVYISSLPIGSKSKTDSEWDSFLTDSSNVIENNRVLGPLSVDVKINQLTNVGLADENKIGEPLIESITSANDIKFILTKPQYDVILRLVQLLTNFSVVWQYALLRPSEPILTSPRKWWKYAIKCAVKSIRQSHIDPDKMKEGKRKVREEYISLWHGFVASGRKKTLLTSSQDKILSMYEKGLPALELISYRVVAYRMLDAERKKDKKKTVAKESGWFSKLRRKTSKKASIIKGYADLATSSETIKQYSQSKTSSHRKQYAIDVAAFSGDLINDDGVCLSTITIEGLNANITDTRYDTTIITRVSNITLRDTATPNVVWETILGSETTSKSTLSLLSCCYAFNKPAAKLDACRDLVSDTYFTIQATRPVRLVLNRHYLAALTEYMHPPKGWKLLQSGLTVGSSEVRDSPRPVGSELRQKKNRDLPHDILTALDDFQTTEIRVIAAGPLVIIPQDCTASESLAVIADLGQLRIGSRLHHAERNVMRKRAQQNASEKDDTHEWWDLALRGMKCSIRPCKDGVLLPSSFGTEMLYDTGVHVAFGRSLIPSRLDIPLVLTRGKVGPEVKMQFTHSNMFIINQVVFEISQVLYDITVRNTSYDETPSQPASPSPKSTTSSGIETPLAAVIELETDTFCLELALKPSGGAIEQPACVFQVSGLRTVYSVPREGFTTVEGYSSTYQIIAHNKLQVPTTVIGSAQNGKLSSNQNIKEETLLFSFTTDESNMLFTLDLGQSAFDPVPDALKEFMRFFAPYCVGIPVSEDEVSSGGEVFGADSNLKGDLFIQGNCSLISTSLTCHPKSRLLVSNINHGGNHEIVIEARTDCGVKLLLDDYHSSVPSNEKHCIVIGAQTTLVLKGFSIYCNKRVIDYILPGSGELKLVDCVVYSDVKEEPSELIATDGSAEWKPYKIKIKTSNSNSTIPNDFKISWSTCEWSYGWDGKAINTSLLINQLRILSPSGANMLTKHLSLSYNTTITKITENSYTGNSHCTIGALSLRTAGYELLEFMDSILLIYVAFYPPESPLGSFWKDQLQVTIDSAVQIAVCAPGSATAFSKIVIANQSDDDDNISFLIDTSANPHEAAAWSVTIPVVASVDVWASRQWYPVLYASNATLSMGEFPTGMPRGCGHSKSTYCDFKFSDETVQIVASEQLLSTIKMLAGSASSPSSQKGLTRRKTLLDTTTDDKLSLKNVTTIDNETGLSVLLTSIIEEPEQSDSDDELGGDLRVLTEISEEPSEIVPQLNKQSWELISSSDIVKANSRIATIRRKPEDTSIKQSRRAHVLPSYIEVSGTVVGVCVLSKVPCLTHNKTCIWTGISIYGSLRLSFEHEKWTLLNITDQTVITSSRIHDEFLSPTSESLTWCDASQSVVELSMKTLYLTEASINFRIFAFCKTNYKFVTDDENAFDTLNEFITTLHQRHIPIDVILHCKSQTLSIPVSEWSGYDPPGMTRFLLKQFFEKYDVESLPKLDLYTDCVTARQADRTEMITKLCRKWSVDQQKWSGDYPTEFRVDDNLLTGQQFESPTLKADLKTAAATEDTVGSLAAWAMGEGIAEDQIFSNQNQRESFTTPPSTPSKIFNYQEEDLTFDDWVEINTIDDNFKNTLQCSSPTKPLHMYIAEDEVADCSVIPLFISPSSHRRACVTGPLKLHNCCGDLIIEIRCESAQSCPRSRGESFPLRCTPRSMKFVPIPALRDCGSNFKFQFKISKLSDQQSGTAPVRKRAASAFKKSEIEDAVVSWSDPTDLSQLSSGNFILTDLFTNLSVIVSSIRNPTECYNQVVEVQFLPMVKITNSLPMPCTVGFLEQSNSPTPQGTTVLAPKMTSVECNASFLQLALSDGLSPPESPTSSSSQSHDMIKLSLMMCCPISDKDRTSKFINLSTNGDSSLTEVVYLESDVSGLPKLPVTITISTNENGTLMVKLSAEVVVVNVTGNSQIVADGIWDLPPGVYIPFEKLPKTINNVPIPIINSNSVHLHHCSAAEDNIQCHLSHRKTDQGETLFIGSWLACHNLLAVPIYIKKSRDQIVCIDVGSVQLLEEPANSIQVSYSSDVSDFMNLSTPLYPETPSPTNVVKRMSDTWVAVNYIRELPSETLTVSVGGILPSPTVTITNSGWWTVHVTDSNYEYLLGKLQIPPFSSLAVHMPESINKQSRSLLITIPELDITSVVTFDCDLRAEGIKSTNSKDKIDISIRYKGGRGVTTLIELSIPEMQNRRRALLADAVAAVEYKVSCPKINFITLRNTDDITSSILQCFAINPKFIVRLGLDTSVETASISVEELLLDSSLATELTIELCREYAGSFISENVIKQIADTTLPLAFSRSSLTVNDLPCVDTVWRSRQGVKTLAAAIRANTDSEVCLLAVGLLDELASGGSTSLEKLTQMQLTKEGLRDIQKNPTIRKAAIKIINAGCEMKFGVSILPSGETSEVSSSTAKKLLSGAMQSKMGTSGVVVNVIAKHLRVREIASSILANEHNQMLATDSLQHLLQSESPDEFVANATAAVKSVKDIELEEAISEAKNVHLDLQTTVDAIYNFVNISNPESNRLLASKLQQLAQQDSIASRINSLSNIVTKVENMSKMKPEEVKSLAVSKLSSLAEDLKSGTTTTFGDLHGAQEVLSSVIETGLQSDNITAMASQKLSSLTQGNNTLSELPSAREALSSVLETGLQSENIATLASDLLNQIPSDGNPTAVQSALQEAQKMVADGTQHFDASESLESAKATVQSTAAMAKEMLGEGVTSESLESVVQTGLSKSQQMVADGTQHFDASESLESAKATVQSTAAMAKEMLGEGVTSESLESARATVQTGVSKAQQMVADGTQHFDASESLESAKATVQSTAAMAKEMLGEGVTSESLESARATVQTGVSKAQQMVADGTQHFDASESLESAKATVQSTAAMAKEMLGEGVTSESLESAKATVQSTAAMAKEMLGEGVTSESLESAKAAVQTGVSKAQQMVADGTQHFDASESLESAKATVQSTAAMAKEMLGEGVTSESLESARATVQTGVSKAQQMVADGTQHFDASESLESAKAAVQTGVSKAQQMVADGTQHFDASESLESAKAAVQTGVSKAQQMVADGTQHFDASESLESAKAAVQTGVSKAQQMVADGTQHFDASESLESAKAAVQTGVSKAQQMVADGTQHFDASESLESAKAAVQTGVSKAQQMVADGTQHFDASESLESAKATVQSTAAMAKEMLGEGVTSESLESAKAAVQTGVSKAQQMVADGTQHFDASESLESAKAAVQTGVSKAQQMVADGTQHFDASESLESARATVQSTAAMAKEMLGEGVTSESLESAKATVQAGAEQAKQIVIEGMGK